MVLHLYSGIIRPIFVKNVISFTFVFKFKIRLACRHWQVSYKSQQVEQVEKWQTYLTN